ncbi:MAG: ATP-grasp domain-containing protein [Candidatus Pacebacteria bacterium]|nr:ATP-grasp domain-containing protein [Candidatus Paceibacterota bacterium]
MQKIRVGVLRGGTSSEYDMSLKTGDAVLAALDTNKYVSKDLLITKDGTWHVNGFSSSPEKITREVDVVFNALHGEYGEDGKVQQQLEAFNIPYTGSRIVPSAIAMNKGLAKHCFEFYGFKTPRSITVKKGDDIQKALLLFFQEVSGRHVVKPLTGRLSLGIGITNSFEELFDAVETVFKENEAVLVEEYIKGRELTCGVVDGLGKDDNYSLYPIEIVKEESEGVCGCGSKYNGQILEVCPANLDEKRSKEIQRLALEAHKQIGLRHYSRSDFIVTGNNIYLLEVNSLPWLAPESLLPKSLKAANLEFPEFVDYLLTLALTKK